MLKLHWFHFIVLKIWLALLMVSSPAAAQGQPVKLNSLLIQLWPEFDRAETLMIYRAELDPSVSLPVQVSFALPEYLDKVFVVAVEQNGRLVEVPAGQYELKKEGAQPVLTFSTDSPRFQFEYYDPQILTKQGTQRQLKFNIPASYATGKVTLEVQEPVETENFSMQPVPTSNFTGNDGLNYHAFDTAGIAAGEVLTLTASYQRQTEALSAASLSSNVAEHAANLPTDLAPVPAPVESDSQNLNIGYGLIGIGVMLLLGVLSWWLWFRKPAPQPVATRRPPRKGRTVAPVVTGGKGGFCYRCGAPLREDANFCHACGAERRQG